MPMQSTIELRDLRLVTDIGTYGPDDVEPEAHILDLVLTVDPRLIMIKEDGMAHVFDYDPLIAKIDALAQDGHYETQERLMTRIVAACAASPEINAVEVALSKTPVSRGTGVLGVRLKVDAHELANLRRGSDQGS